MAIKKLKNKIFSQRRTNCLVIQMEQLVGTLVSSILSIYLPIGDVGSRVAISLAVSGIVVKILTLLYDLAVKYDIINLIWNRGGSYLIIEPSNEQYNKILKYMYTNYFDMLSGCALETDNGRNKLSAVKLKKTFIKEKFYHDGASYDIQFSLENGTPNSDKKNNTDNSSSKPNIVIRSDHSVKILESYFNNVIQNIDNKISNKIPIYRTDIISLKKDNRIIRWKCNVTKLSKNIKNTIVSETVQKNFYADVDKFINSEQFYLEKGLPYKRGYLLYGEPGCGKTSLIKAIANQYKLPIFIIDLSIIFDNAELIKITNDISSHLTHDQKYLVVFEDIDRSRMFDKWSRSSITLDCFLNVLDGVDEYYGRITILTTNNLETITENSKALVRPGRIDTIVEVPICTIKQIEKILKFYFSTDVQINLDQTIIITPAQLTQLIFAVNDINRVIHVLNKNKNFSKINIEKVNDIYQQATEPASDEIISESDQQLNTDNSDDDSNDDPHLWRKKRITAQKEKLSTIVLKIGQLKDAVDSMSKQERIRYDRLVLSKESTELAIGDLTKKLELHTHLEGIQNPDSRRNRNRIRSSRRRV